MMRLLLDWRNLAVVGIAAVILAVFSLLVAERDRAEARLADQASQIGRLHEKIDHRNVEIDDLTDEVRRLLGRIDRLEETVILLGGDPNVPPHEQDDAVIRREAASLASPPPLPPEQGPKPKPGGPRKQPDPPGKGVPGPPDHAPDQHRR